MRSSKYGLTNTGAALWEPYLVGRVDQLDTMFFGHFKYAVRHFMTSKGFFRKKFFEKFSQFFEIFEYGKG